VLLFVTIIQIPVTFNERLNDCDLGRRNFMNQGKIEPNAAMEALRAQKAQSLVHNCSAWHGRIVACLQMRLLQAFSKILANSGRTSGNFF
jgi:hypothetical protein